MHVSRKKNNERKDITSSGEGGGGEGGGELVKHVKSLALFITNIPVEVALTSPDRKGQQKLMVSKEYFLILYIYLY